MWVCDCVKERERQNFDENKELKMGWVKAMGYMARLCTSFNLLSEPCARPCKLQCYLITLSVFLTGFLLCGVK